MNRESLEKPFAPEQIRQRKGRNGVLDYVEEHSVIQGLNEALEGAWSFEIVHRGVPAARGAGGARRRVSPTETLRSAAPGSLDC
jgi:hypothetical protein